MCMRLRVELVCLLAVFLAAHLPLKAELTTRVFEMYSAANGLADNSAQTIKCTKTGRLVITTMGQINFFDGHQFSYIDPTNENRYPLPDYLGNYHLYFDRYHHLWLKDRNSVTCVNLMTERFVDSIEDEFAAFGITDRVRNMFVDNDGVVFLLTDKGLYSVEAKKYFKVRDGHHLQDLETYSDRYLLLFYENGELDVLEQGTGDMVFLSKSYGAGDYKRYEKSSVILEDGSTYYQIRNGEKESILQRFDVGQWQWTTLLTVPYHLNNMELKDSTLYIPCEYGYWTYRIPSGEATHYERIQMMHGKPLETNTNAIAFDRQGGIWIGTETRGLLYSRPFNVPFRVYSWDDEEALRYARMMDMLPANKPFRDYRANCLYRDSRGWQWVGTSSGLLLFRSDADKLPRVFTRRDGLLNNVIHTIVEDEKHNIWTGTSYGLSRLEFDKSGEFLNVISYDSYDNIPNESFANGRAMRLDDGTIVMQMQDHVLAFNPAKMMTLSDDMAFRLYPKLVKLLVNGTEVRTGDRLGGKVILDRALTRTPEINVDYDQNSLSLTFSGLNYFRPLQTFYRVRVREIDDAWKVYTAYNSDGIVDGKGQLHLPLLALAPGTYTIELQASMAIDKWETEPYVWTVRVHEPWWRKSAVFLLLGLVLAALLLGNVYLYVRNFSLSARRYGEELPIIKRIKTFVGSCYDQNFLLEASPEELSAQDGADTRVSLAPEFIEVMSKLTNVIQKKSETQLSMQMLSSQAGMDLQKFYGMVNSNIYKNPRDFVKHIMLLHSEELLRTSDMDIEDIAKACRFATPNYFIASFYRAYGMLPDEYRRKGRSF